MSLYILIIQNGYICHTVGRWVGVAKAKRCIFQILNKTLIKLMLQCSNNFETLSQLIGFSLQRQQVSRKGHSVARYDHDNANDKQLAPFRGKHLLLTRLLEQLRFWYLLRPGTFQDSFLKFQTGISVCFFIEGTIVRIPLVYLYKNITSIFILKF